MPCGLRQSRINPKENGVKMACNGCTPTVCKLLTIENKYF